MSFSHFLGPARGATLELGSAGPVAAALFGEYQSRILITLEPSNLENLTAIASKHGVDIVRLGMVSGDQLRIRWGDRILIDEPVAALEDIWRQSLARSFQSQT
jgi:phosphoribosylformylglycinamidine synthase